MLCNLSVILVRPRFPENIGMVSRAMANMGVSDLILVDPERWEKDKALPLATAQGGPVLDAVRLAESLEAALPPYVAAFGTSARTGGWREDMLSPERAAKAIRTEARQGGRVALVFGPEDRGLRNDETEQCSRLVHIPTAGGHSSLNLAQAVLLLLYECFKADLALPFSVDESARAWTGTALSPVSRRVTLEEESLLLRHLEQTLLEIGHLPENNPDWFMRPVRRFIRKSRLRRHEFDMLMGVCRQITLRKG